LGTTVVLFLAKNFLVKKRNVRRCIIAVQQPVFFCQSSGRSLHTFSYSHNVRKVCRIDCLATQDEFFVNIPFYVKENYDHDYCSSRISPFSVCPEPSKPFKHQCTADAFFRERLYNHCHGLCCNFSYIFTKFDAHSLSDPSRNRIRPDTLLQIKELKNQHFHPAA
jgi:hypothetical protein